MREGLGYFPYKIAWENCLINLQCELYYRTGKDSMMKDKKVIDKKVIDKNIVDNKTIDNKIEKYKNKVNKAEDIRISNIKIINEKFKNKKNKKKLNNELHIKDNTHGLSRNIGIDYMFRFLSNFNLTGAVWVLYLGYRGMSLGQIGLLEGFFHIVSFLFEVPTGALADLAGRKKTMLLGRVSAILSGFLMITINNFWGYAIAFAFSAASYNLNSGSEEALVYDSLKSLKREEEFLKINSRLNFIQEAASGFASFLGGVIAEVSFFYAYTAGILINAAAFLTGNMLNEPEVEHNQEKIHISTMKEHFVICISILKHNKPVRRVLIFYPVVTAFATATFFYGQQHFSNMGLNKIQISFIILISGVLASLGALSADKFSRIFGEKGKYVGATGLAVFIAAFGINNDFVAVTAFLIQSYFTALLYPISSNALNELIPSRQRATIISVSSMMFSAAMIVIFPICGFAGDSIGLGKVFYILGVLIIIFQVWFMGRVKSDINR
jgi:MFS family permease